METDKARRPAPFTPGGVRSSIGGYSGAMVLLYLVSAGARISLSLLCWCLSWEGENGWELASTVLFPYLLLMTSLSFLTT